MGRYIQAELREQGKNVPKIKGGEDVVKEQVGGASEEVGEVVS